MTVSIRLFAMIALLAGCTEAAPPAAPSLPALDRATASRYAQLAIAGITREYPNKLEHVMNGPEDVRGPRVLHPSFYGSYDWHSAVHGRRMLVRLLAVVPDLPEAADIRRVLDQHLSAVNLAAEVAYLGRAGSASFERMYGWAWLLKLAEELHHSLLQPAVVTDRADPGLVHLDGLNLSRAWCMRAVALALPDADPARPVLLASAARHAETSLPYVASGDYLGEHWLASFAAANMAAGPLPQADQTSDVPSCSIERLVPSQYRICPAEPPDSAIQTTIRTFIHE